MNRSLLHFKEHITFEDVPYYLDLYRDMEKHNDIIFDLRRTETIHSSFIGFLIHVKHLMEKNGRKLVLLLSNEVERTLIMLNIMDFFDTYLVSSYNKKSA